MCLSLPSQPFCRHLLEGLERTRQDRVHGGLESATGLLGLRTLREDWPSSRLLFEKMSREMGYKGGPRSRELAPRRHSRAT